MKHLRINPLLAGLLVFGCCNQIHCADDAIAQSTFWQRHESIRIEGNDPHQIETLLGTQLETKIPAWLTIRDEAILWKTNKHCFACLVTEGKRVGTFYCFFETGGFGPQLVTHFTLFDDIVVALHPPTEKIEEWHLNGFTGGIAWTIGSFSLPPTGRIHSFGVEALELVPVVVVMFSNGEEEEPQKLAFLLKEGMFSHPSFLALNTP